ncbi:ornithine carbamoyltransferase [Roseivirga ehrenbergii]|uniref:N-succinylornithine carbamoyltransferase n=1 Tax=Roseivirga ehrenbergii (strain DSM 102268 / JCM 13514 / KCTC 12282 / NCIMB 14502 / KMM 6017) TaxID=279360 RepID=A0A150XQP0_ROSEK|nr:N-acetylornithine carbamoyltransferase [Roseivirga ehrenbergii]KYG81011.1 acetylornithine carbamoyltransferase [Roseivirga ehrenbergii]TCL00875.1 ornithine carbamoyltransferase [Roseivirga ehrenbergii]
MKNFTSVKDVQNINALVEKALSLKANPFQTKLAEGKRIGLIFFNPSLRTRLSSQVAAQNLGAQAIVLDIGKDGWALEFEDGVVMNGDKAEHIKEAAAVMGRYFDVLGVRTFPELKSKEADYSEKLLNAFIKYAGVPIVSLESGTRHPLQSLADLVTIKEQWVAKRKPKVVLTWAPHVKALPQAVPNSFAEWIGKADVDFSIANPEGYDLAEEFREGVTVFHDQAEALKDADFVYVKNWSSYDDYGRILSQDERWTFGSKQLELTENAKVMHCLPVRRGLVIKDEILDGPNAIHLEQAENRVYAAQAVFHELLMPQI